MFKFLRKIFGTAQDRLINKYKKIVEKVNALEVQYQALSDEELRHKTIEFKERLSKGETTDELLPEAYAVVKSACRRLCGTDVHVSGYDQKWDMIPFDVQIIGAIAMHYGTIAEMQTGEGKTLTAVMPLYLNALVGESVHLVTVNDYLAKRDCQWAGVVLRWLGLSTGVIANDTPMDQRKSVYETDVVYGTASEFGFDYLRDNSIASRKEEQVQRGFYYAIIDEADSILIDEARTPLIISGPVPDSRQMYDQLKDGAADLVRKQRDLCNRLVSEARKIIDTLLVDGQIVTNDKLKLTQFKEACHKLWLVSKGTPQNKTLKRFKEDPDVRKAIDEWDLHYYAEQNKEDKHKALSDLFIIIDEKSNDYEITDKGINAWHQSTGESEDDFVMLDISHEYALIDENKELNEEQRVQRKLQVQQEDALRKERAHNLRQLLRAHLLMEKDNDYIIEDGKIVIIDENTGRPQPGRRFADGLHQAIEAKEAVKIQQETQTYATITLQNFFRMYKKLAGMTGTASTEANELKQIYKLDVLEIPTHRACLRKDANDEIYMTEREKYNAILKEVMQIHAQGRPILIGTESVEVSEKLSRIFRLNKLEHTILNAKQHEREAEIIAMAGKRGAITISTNMAGRGTDIKLEKGVAELGGLHVIGTTRHQSRRVDRQLRGRCARQGDPGSSKFFISFEDNLLRLFASPRLTGFLHRFRPEEGEAISAPILDHSVATAQKRIEQKNFTMRKHTLEYDDVMNKQRQEIYSFRNEIIRTDEVGRFAEQLIYDVIAVGAGQFFQNHSEEGAWDPEGFREWLMRHFPVSFPEGYFDQEYIEVEELEELAAKQIIQAFKDKIDRENAKVPVNLNNGQQVKNHSYEAIRDLIIRKNDQLWQEHLLTMDHLRSDVNLRSFGQRDPLMEFKHEAFALFDEFGKNLRTDIAQGMFRFEIIPYSHPSIQQILAGLQMETNRSFLSDLEKTTTNGESAPQPEEEIESNQREKLEPVVVGPKTGRNDSCPCGSGKKYKKCCGINSEE
ncbi:preprotein translocase subunit SecA [Candidatus Rubidus massiliensis]|nr:preprotein translocase subunit SecA [Candidatus Rubidus massiliensis]